jgi:predicted regulator of Ras-like GTPase activity (Roadblock/LC7/MglB family)
MSELRAQLNDFLKLDGISAAVVISRDGFVIEGESANGNLDKEAVGAVVSVGMGSLAVMANELQVGDLSQTMFESAKGTVVITSVGDSALLALVSDSSANLGNIRYQLKKRMPKLEAAL